MMRKSIRFVAVAAALAGSLATGAGAQGAGAGPNQLTPAEQKMGWRLLFDGKTTNGWRGYRQQAAPTGWNVVDGTLAKTGPVEDIVSTEQFGDFELAIDWKIGAGGNSGLFYRGTEEYDHIYWSAPEYQLLDDSLAADGKNRLTSAGAAYAVYPSPAGGLKPVGQWNSTRIVVKGAHVEHWLNGEKVVEYELWSQDWKDRVAKSKFNAMPRYGLEKTGFIALQDHGFEVAFRNVKIKVLP